MHAMALRFISEHLLKFDRIPSIVEIGSRNINGSVREAADSHSYQYSSYIGVDLLPGPGVDIVADAIVWRPKEPVDIVICTSVLEHHPEPALLIKAAKEMLVSRGLFLVTTTVDPWEPHSSIDGEELKENEYYGNIKPEDMCRWLDDWTTYSIMRAGSHDLLCWAFVNRD